jgi:3-oxoacyl-[acyl-carrier-protein] synthase-1
VEEKMAYKVTNPVYAIASNILSALGMDTDGHWKAVVTKRTGIRQYEDAALSNVPFYASKMEPAQWQRIHEDTKMDSILSSFEQMAIYSARQALRQCQEAIDLSQTVLILSTTKGNIEWLDQVPDSRLTLHSSAAVVARHLGLSVKPIVISHACVSGVVALQYGLRLLQSGRYKNAIVVGADRFTRFVLSGFQSFQAIADEPCRPFDAHRKGINLGEAAASIILSTNPGEEPLARFASGSTSNDANHISGPSRTGEELSHAINRAFSDGGVTCSDINMISAHGTATLYNDEMESKAFGIAGVGDAPLHSFKGYIGHTLGAAGVVESAMIIESLQRQQLIPSLGFTELGVSQHLNVVTEAHTHALNYVLKTASGFGGCNAAAIWARA